MRTVETIAELRHQVTAAHGRGERVALVPTMGNLHDGHRALMRVARAQCDFVVATAYVNPTQFAPNEDYERYPRTPGQDAAIAESAGVDILWRPTDDEMYGPVDMHGNRPGLATRVHVGSLGRRLCGNFRPGHFDGVATVVVKIVNAVQSDVLYLGEKDFQQTVVLRQVLRDLNIPIELRTIPTVRDADGLALSSRNSLLGTEHREASLAIPAALAAARAVVEDGERLVGRIRARAEIALSHNDLVRPQYVEVVDPVTLESLDALEAPAMLLIAAHVGDVRLIDNCLLDTTATSSIADEPAPHATTGQRP